MRIQTVFIASAALAAALAAAGPELRPARTADLPGVWVMVDQVRNAPFDPEDTVFAPYQLFAFDQKGGMKHMTSPKQFTDSQLALFSAAPQVTRYTVEKDGTLVLANPSWDAPIKYQCRVVTKTEDPDTGRSPREGDLVLSSIDAHGKEAWSKLLRKATP
jgi:hypothetical protein